MENREIEFKYKAAISLSDFKTFCENRKPLNYLLISGFDHFYSNKAIPTSFYRHRVNTNENQLTFKRKTVDNNNFIREEHNIDLPMSVTASKIEALCKINGYYYDNSLFKNCFIYNYEYYTIVYYVCYNKELEEVGRFIEIEMKEDYNWKSEDEAYGELITLEKLCKPLKISSDTRVLDSLYEMFGRSNAVQE